MKHQKMKKGQTVFNFGDFGSLFYMIIKGSVSVHVALEREYEMTNEELFHWIVESWEDLDHERFRNSKYGRFDKYAGMIQKNPNLLGGGEPAFFTRED